MISNEITYMFNDLYHVFWTKHVIVFQTNMCCLMLLFSNFVGGHLWVIWEYFGGVF